MRSIQHRARYANLYLSFSGVDGPELEGLRDECPELRGVPTAVYSEEQVRRVREIIEYVGPIMDMLELDMMHTSDGPTTVKMNPARGIVPQVRGHIAFHCLHSHLLPLIIIIIIASNSLQS